MSLTLRGQGLCFVLLLWPQECQAQSYDIADAKTRLSWKCGFICFILTLDFPKVFPYSLSHFILTITVQGRKGTMIIPISEKKQPTCLQACCDRGQPGIAGGSFHRPWSWPPGMQWDHAGLVRHRAQGNAEVLRSRPEWVYGGTQGPRTYLPAGHCAGT